MRSLFLTGLLASGIFAQTTTPLPEKHIPPAVLMELRELENQFDWALSRDCAPEKCVSKGCVYRDHAVVDLPRNGSLPGLGQTQGPGSVPAQEYLTSARCEFAHEKNVSTKDVQALVRRLEQRLSKGWRQVSVSHQLLDTISPTLAESPPPKPEAKPKEEEPQKPAEPLAPTEWDAQVALRELWVNLLPHFSWMIAVVLGTLAVLCIIWAWRRLGRETAEEKALLAAMTQTPSEEGSKTPNAPEEASLTEVTPLPEEDAALTEQKRIWAERMAQADFAKNEGMVSSLLHQWLKTREFALLAKAIFLFGDQLTVAFSADPELAELKVEFAEYLRSVDASTLPEDEVFFKKLNQHAVSSSILAQSDAETYQSLHREFGSGAVATLMKQLPPRQGAVLFGLLPVELQSEVSRTLAPEFRVLVAQQLLSSNRASRDERSYVFQALTETREGKALTPPPKTLPNEIVDRGSEFDAAGALSNLLPHIASEARQALFGKVLQKAHGELPRWYEDILYPDMLSKLPNEVQADMLLEVDLKGLAGWSSMQPLLWQDEFFSRLTPSLQKAVRANMSFASREEQLLLAKKGRNELVEALKRRAARGGVSLAELLS